MKPYISKLVLGRISERTVCPFRPACAIAHNSQCYHQGENHTTTYSCGTARWFDLCERNKVQVVDSDEDNSD